VKNASEKLLPLKTAARAIGVRPENLRAEADAGKVPHIRLGDDYLFALDSLESSLLSRVMIGKAVVDVR
jgi:hypothetical protein